MVAIGGGYRVTYGWHYTKLFLSSALLLSFSDMCLCHCSFLFVVFFFFFSCSRWSFVDVPLIGSCPADHIPDWQPRILLGMVEARSVNVKNTTTTTTTFNMPTSFQHRKRKRWRDRFNLALANQQSLFYLASYFASVLTPSS